MISSELLAQIPLLKNLSPEDLEDLGTLFRQQKVAKGDVLFRKGSEGTALYIIQEGAVKIVLPSRLGDERIVAIFSAGDFFGEMALFDGMPRSADAVAIKPSRLLLLNRSDFLRFLKKNESAMKKTLSSLSMRLRKADDLLEETSFLAVPARLARKVLEIGDTCGHTDGEAIEIHIKLSQKELANMVGATRESINKELRVLREKGLVSVTEKAIHIHDIKRLKRRAG